jgi:hypothetical protein
MTNNYFTDAQVERWTSNFEKMRIDRVSVFENTPAVVNFNFEAYLKNPFTRIWQVPHTD